MKKEIKELKLAFKELERKIEEEDYDGSSDGFEDEFYALRDLVEDLFRSDLENNELSKVNKINKALDRIRDEHDLYNEADELERLFPNGNEEDFDN